MGQAISLTSSMHSNLFSLQQTNKMMEMTQSRLATGKKVQSALDDPINFFAAKEHNQRASDLSSRKDAMGEAVQTIKAASAGIESISDLIQSAKSLAQSAISASDCVEAGALMDQYKTTMTQLDGIVNNSGYKGNNLLKSDTENIEIKFSADGTQSLTVTGFNSNAVAGLGITVAASWTDATTTIAVTEIEEDMAELDSAVTKLRTEESKLSNNLSIITARQDFTDGMINVLESGANNLTNADMNEEGANMLMLQTRQSLGTSSLSIASQAAQAVLRLF